MTSADKRRLGIYLHVPFCMSKCAYCDFYSYVPKNEQVYERYANALISHMEHYKSAAAGCAPDSVYIGGGTPTVLPREQLLKIVRAVRRNFTLAKNAEFTVEANPATVDLSTLRALRWSGVNRISMGLQSADPRELKALSRIHTRGDFEDSYYMARKAKIENISVDLMFGIPYQTTESLLRSIDYVTRLDPEHISLYNLKIEPNTHFGKIGAANLALPDEDEEFRMYIQACQFLESKGYKQYEISNFAKPGKMSRHNLKYWNCEEYLGLGPSAHSYFNGTRFSFIPSINQYMKGIENMGSEIIISDGSEQISGRAMMGEYIMLRFRLTEGLVLSDFQRKFGYDFEEMYGNKLRPYIEGGYMIRTRDGFALTPRGMFVSNYILSDILSYADLNAITPASEF
ncbi:MAG: radical SAM family heme chaperone HemW [Clostridia bacterium]|nr:radical SAM family heme chaperone HemW [Clostridia bacterium]